MNHIQIGWWAAGRWATPGSTIRAC